MLLIFVLIFFVLYLIFWFWKAGVESDVGPLESSVQYKYVLLIKDRATGLCIYIFIKAFVNTVKLYNCDKVKIYDSFNACGCGSVIANIWMH